MLSDHYGPASVFGTPMDGDGTGTTSGWELQDLIHPVVKVVRDLWGLSLLG